MEYIYVQNLAFHLHVLSVFLSDMANDEQPSDKNTISQPPSATGTSV